MEFFSVSFQSAAARSRAKGIAGLQAAPRIANLDRLAEMPCGWSDSSYELREGLEVIEQDDDMLYQFWELSGGRATAFGYTRPSVALRVTDTSAT